MSVSYLFPPGGCGSDNGSEGSFVDIVFDQTAVICAVKRLPRLSKPQTKRDTKAIGDLSELIVAAERTRVGYTVSKPLGDSHRYDLIIDDGDRLSRVQVKTGRLGNGSIRVPCSSSHVHRGGTLRSYRGEIDFIGVFCPQTGEVYLVPESEITDTVIHLRVEPTVNRQDKRIRWAGRYRLT